MKKIILNFTLFILIILQFNFASAEPLQNIDLWRKGTVNITNNVIRSPYDNIGKYTGTGFLIDKQGGIILTNKHVVNNVNLNDTYVTFYNGRETQAKLIYSDPIQDFSFLKIDTKKIPLDAMEFKLSTDFPNLGEAVTIIGSNEGQSFSVQSGLITSVNEKSGFFSNQTIRISLNTRGGSSGSPIINAKGEVIALNHAIDNTYAYAIPSGYFVDAFNDLKENKIPVRQDIGAILNYHSLDTAVRYLNFPENLISKYLNDFPNSSNKCIIVDSSIKGTPSEQYLQPSDIIWSADGKPIGSSIFSLQKLFNESKTGYTKLQVYRNGKLIEVKIPLYNLFQDEIKKLVVFEGAVFFEADNLISFITGVEPKSLFLINIDNNSSFKNVRTMNWNENLAYALKIKRLGDCEINNLDDLIKAIPILVKKEYFVTHYINYMGKGGFNGNMYNARNLEFDDIKYNGSNGNPLLLTYDEVNKTWIKQDILK